MVVGDRVLIKAADGEDKSRAGIYLPAAAIEKMAIQGGKVVEVGPGQAIANPAEVGDEPWKNQDGKDSTKYVPLDAKVGDYALFLRNASIEIEFEEEQYLIVPYSAIMLLVRDDAGEGEPDAEFRAEDFKL